MRFEQLPDQRVPVPARGERFPTGKCRLAVEFDQRAQAIEQQRRTLQEVTVLGLEQRDGFGLRARPQ